LYKRFWALHETFRGSLTAAMTTQPASTSLPSVALDGATAYRLAEE